MDLHVPDRSKPLPFALAAAAVAVLIVTAVVALIVVLTGSNGMTMRPGEMAAMRKQTTPAPSAPAMVTPSPQPSPRSSPVAENSPVASKPAPKAKTERKPLTYTVKKGDNLTVIAEWFKLRGYGDLYDWNKVTIGDDPDLIRPGQKITVSTDGMTSSR